MAKIMENDKAAAAALPLTGTRAASRSPPSTHRISRREAAEAEGRDLVGWGKPPDCENASGGVPHHSTPCAGSFHGGHGRKGAPLPTPTYGWPTSRNIPAPSPTLSPAKKPCGRLVDARKIAVLPTGERPVSAENTTQDARVGPRPDLGWRLCPAQ